MEEQKISDYLEDYLNEDLIRMMFSNPKKDNDCTKVKVRPLVLQNQLVFQATIYRGTQVFHENLGKQGMLEKADLWMKDSFRQLEILSKNRRLNCLVSKKGTITIKEKKEEAVVADGMKLPDFSHNRKKKYLLEENVPVGFLIDLGVQTEEGRIVHASYDKFKQINRFLEFVEDILPSLQKEGPITVLDFGCGKSYLTFALYHYLHVVCGRDVRIIGLDLKKDVIMNCNLLAEKYQYTGLHFYTGDIKDYTGESKVDMVVTLHACDTATDYALYKAMNWDAKVILSVPCCQHEVNKQIHCDALDPMLEHGIVKERMSALVTDSLRAKILEANGYRTQLLEFVDMAHTPKNLLIRAVKERNSKDERAMEEIKDFTQFLEIHTTLQMLTEEE